MLYFKFNELNFQFQEAEKSESNKRRKQNRENDGNNKRCKVQKQ